MKFILCGPPTLCGTRSPRQVLSPDRLHAIKLKSKNSKFKMRLPESALHFNLRNLRETFTR